MVLAARSSTQETESAQGGALQASGVRVNFSAIFTPAGESKGVALGEAICLHALIILLFLRWISRRGNTGRAEMAYGLHTGRERV